MICPHSFGLGLTAVWCLLASRASATPDLVFIQFEDEGCTEYSSVDVVVVPVGLCTHVGTHTREDEHWELYSLSLHPDVHAQRLVPQVVKTRWEDKQCTQPILDVLVASDSPLRLDACYQQDYGYFTVSTLRQRPLFVGFELALAPLLVQLLVMLTTVACLLWCLRVRCRATRPSDRATVPTGDIVGTDTIYMELKSAKVDPEDPSEPTSS